MADTPKNFIITGTSGTGKTALIECLAERGFTTFGEAARAILTEHLATDGPGLPAKNPTLFLRLMQSHCLRSLEAADQIDGPTFFDRGLPDVIAYAIRFRVDPGEFAICADKHRYTDPVFVLPPWEHIFVQDELRGKSFGEYVEFHQMIRQAYQDAGYCLCEVPCISVEERADHLLSSIEAR